MGRIKDREEAFKLIYQTEINKENFKTQLDYYFDEKKMEPASIAYIDDIVTGVNLRLEEINSSIGEHLVSTWKIDRISKVDLAILRLSCYEIKYRADVPREVSINEAVELAKKYGSDASARFVNGILANITRPD